MNDIDARGREVYGGFQAEYRLPRSARWHAVSVNGVAQIYGSAAEAECMAWRELRRLAFGVIRSTNHPASNARSEAERMFKSIFHKGRQIPVEQV